MLHANTQRVLDDLYHLRSIGAYKTGVHRPTLSADDMIARPVARRSIACNRAQHHD